MDAPGGGARSSAAPRPGPRPHGLLEARAPARAKVSTERWWSASVCTSSRQSDPGPGDRRHHGRVTAFAHVHDALEQGMSLRSVSRWCSGLGVIAGTPGCPGVSCGWPAGSRYGGGAGSDDVRARMSRPTRRGRPGCRGRTRGTAPLTGHSEQVFCAICTPMPSLGKKTAGSMSLHLPWAIHSLSMAPPMPRSQYQRDLVTNL